MNLSIVLLNLLIVSIVVEQCSCHIGEGQHHGLLDRMARSTANPKRRSSSNKSNNPISLGIQRAIAHSSLPDSWKRLSHSSSSTSTLLAVNHDYDDDSEEAELDLLTGISTHATRFASVQPKEQSEITLTMTPHLKQKRPSKQSVSFGRCLGDMQQKTTNEESLLLSDTDILDLHDEEFEQSLVPCSISVAAHPAALQGKFGPKNPRRLTPSSSSMAATAAVEASTIATSSSAEKARGGGNTAIVAAASTVAHRPLMFWENMVSGAVSRSIAQTVMHPANTMKTMLQSSRDVTLLELFQPQMFRRLTVGAGANFILSIPHGAVNFAVLEFVRGRFNAIVESVAFLEERKDAIGPGLDFLSSAVSTITCSIVSTPQMMITDNIMAGNYPNLISATRGLYSSRGVMGFYAGWWPGLVGKIPSYALTWTFFQQLKRMRSIVSDRPAKDYENTIMGCMASAATVCIMIPMDTIKTRLVAQTGAKIITGVPYKGIVDCAVRIAQEEGIKTFYRGLAPRLISVVPMIGIQFGVYEAMKRVMLQRDITKAPPAAHSWKVLEMTDRYGPEEAMEEAAMEVAADGSNTFPAPHFLKKLPKQSKKKPLFGIRFQ